MVWGSSKGGAIPPVAIFPVFFPGFEDEPRFPSGSGLVASPPHGIAGPALPPAVIGNNLERLTAAIVTCSGLPGTP